MDRTTIGVAVAGFGWMGRVHTQSYARVLHHFPGLAVRPELVAAADEALGRAEEAAARYGFEAYHFLRSVAEGKPHGTTLDDAVRSAAALDAMARSVETGGWVTVGPA